MVDYLKGLSFLHENGIMHRDINPNTSFDYPKGLIIDLDSATTEEMSTDHMQGTLAYLAPEIVDLKSQIPGSYNKSVDIWALGLSAFAIHTGRPLRWTYTDSHGAHPSYMVEQEAYRAYKTKISQSLKLTQDTDAAGLLRLIAEMTEYKPNKRITASSALAKVAKLAEGLKGKIVLKAGHKRRRGE